MHKSKVSVVSTNMYRVEVRDNKAGESFGQVTVFKRGENVVAILTQEESDEFHREYAKLARFAETIDEYQRRVDSICDVFFNKE